MLSILLDAHISPAIAEALRSDGHDVRAIAEERALEGLADDRVLEVGATDGRILVTHNVKDFVPLLRTWVETGRATHGGCVLVQGIGNHEFGRILRGLRLLFADRPEQDDWTDLAIFLTRSA